MRGSASARHCPPAVQAADFRSLFSLREAHAVLHDVVPAIGIGTDDVTPGRMDATIVLVSVTVPPLLLMPPPVVAVFRFIVQLVSVTVPAVVSIPPPEPPGLELPLTVQLVSESVPLLEIPPPLWPAVFPLRVQLVSVAVPEFEMPAPSVAAVLSDTVHWFMVSVVVLSIAPPLMLAAFALRTHWSSVSVPVLVMAPPRLNVPPVMVRAFIVTVPLITLKTRVPLPSTIVIRFLCRRTRVASAPMVRSSRIDRVPPASVMVWTPVPGMLNAMVSAPGLT